MLLCQCTDVDATVNLCPDALCDSALMDSAVVTMLMLLCDSALPHATV